MPDDTSLERLLTQQLSIPALAAREIAGRVVRVGPDGKLEDGSKAALQASVQNFGNTSGARAIDCTRGSLCALTATGAVTISFTNGPGLNASIRMTLNITNGGSNITWPAGTRWAGPGVVGSAPTLATTGTDKVVVEISNIGGTTYYDATYIGRVA